MTTTILTKVNQVFQMNLRVSDQKNTAINYMKDRNISGESAQRFNLGFASDAWDHVKQHFKEDNKVLNELVELGVLAKMQNGHRYDRFRNRIMFPIRDVEGQVVSFGGRILADGTPKYLNGAESSLFNKSEHLYGLFETLHVHDNPIRIVVVEGYIDVVMTHQLGVDYTVSCMGTSLTKQHMALLSQHTAEVVCCYDGDAAGEKAAIRTALLSLANPQLCLKFATLPLGEDPDTYIKEKGKAAFEQVLNNAVDANVLLMNVLANTCFSEHNVLVHQLKGLKDLLKECETADQETGLLEAFSEQFDVSMTALYFVISSEESEVKKLQDKTVKAQIGKPVFSI
jgi:DNA primase